MNPRIENLLQISINSDEDFRRQIPDLSAGFNESDRTWEVVVKTAAGIQYLSSVFTETQFIELLCGYWIIRGTIQDIEQIAEAPEIIYVEKPKAMYSELYAAKSEACVNLAKSDRTPYNGVTGRGVLVAVIDTGIDIADDEFLNEDGTTRIKAIWDQGTDIRYDSDEINASLEDYRQGRTRFLPAADRAGHGNEVAVIACGNEGVASDADIIIVRLGNAGGDPFIRTTQLMRGLDYCIRKAIEYGQPVAVNISYGGNYGNHEGNSIFEMFIDDCCGTYRCSVCIGAGNEGEGRTHYLGKLDNYSVQNVELAIGDYEPQISIQIWKRFMDECVIELFAPTGESVVISDINTGFQEVDFNNMQLVTGAYGPGPFYMEEEIYTAIAASSGYITPGIWNIRFSAGKIVDGTYNIWLPSVVTLSGATGFLRPSPEYTFTIPSTSRRGICVGATGIVPGSAAVFSGRGVTVDNSLILYAKPDITAPGVNIRIPGQLEKYVTGTSFAAPMVTGAAAMLMEWGIVKGNDSDMFGEKVKAYLIRGATRTGGIWPDSARGWGELCVAASIPE